MLVDVMQLRVHTNAHTFLSLLQGSCEIKLTVKRRQSNAHTFLPLLQSHNEADSQAQTEAASLDPATALPQLLPKQPHKDIGSKRRGPESCIVGVPAELRLAASPAREPGRQLPYTHVSNVPASKT